MVIARRNVRHQRAQHIEGSTLADGLLYLHIRGNLIHGHMPRPFDHDLHILFPGARRQLTEHNKFLDL